MKLWTIGFSSCRLPSGYDLRLHPGVPRPCIVFQLQVVDEAGFASDPARTAKPRPFLVGRCASPVEARTALTLDHGFSTFVVVVDAFGFL